MSRPQLFIVTGENGSQEPFPAALALAEAIAGGTDACCFLNLSAAATLVAEIGRRQIPVDVCAFPSTQVPKSVVDQFPTMMQEIGVITPELFSSLRA